jgi:hypothetical protein
MPEAFACKDGIENNEKGYPYPDHPGPLFLLEGQNSIDENENRGYEDHRIQYSVPFLSAAYSAWYHSKHGHVKGTRRKGTAKLSRLGQNLTKQLNSDKSPIDRT